mmetsp:Transcript_69621/g.148930  ORF Transcript_69621/g.148930 Transcript_69621/m.148930 type:complete len:256 (+) Transcript_69621:86-853(+)
MAFRGDIQGGAASGPASLAGGVGLQGLTGGQGVSGIEKTLKWKLFFFGGACVTFLTAVITIFYWISRFAWAPATFVAEVFLLIFGILMIVLDFPIPHPHKHLVAIRDNCYKFVLFMTRFMGRGCWYLFLATMVFSALWDSGVNYFTGAAFTTYLVILGVCALVKGWMLSNKLQTVREAIVSQGRSAEHYIARGQTGLSKEQFKAMVESVTNQSELFSSDDLDYIINALSFTPDNDGQVSMEECEYWLRAGPMLMV